MDILRSVILGIVQGLTEFLPISSSAHLYLVPEFFGWRDPGLGFDVALHWGTLLAVILFFRKDLINLTRGFWHSLFRSTRDFGNNIYQKLSWYLIVASIPGAIVGKLLEEKAETVFRSPLLVAATLSAFGILLYFVDRYGKNSKNLDRTSFMDALLIGASQALAIVPGVSRSGSTIAAGRALGLTRGDAARFSFLMSVPIIFGAGLVKANEFHTGVTTAELISGFTAAALSGFFAIKYLLRYLSSHNFNIFVWYRIILAVMVIAFLV